MILGFESGPLDCLQELFAQFNIARQLCLDASVVLHVFWLDNLRENLPLDMYDLPWVESHGRVGLPLVDLSDLIRSPLNAEVLL